MSGSRSRIVILIATLFVLAAVLGIVTNMLVGSTVQLGHFSGPPLRPEIVTSSGMLLITTSLNESGRGLTPLVNVNATVLALGGPFSFPVAPIVFRTNSTGQIELPLDAGAYSVTVFAAGYRNSTQAVVQANKTTFVDVTVDRTLYPIAFSEVSEQGSSGFAGPWATISVAVSTNSASFHPNDLVFVATGFDFFVVRNSGPGVISNFTSQEGNNTFASDSSPNGKATFYFSPGNYTMRGGLGNATASETPARVISAEFRNYGRSGLLWMTLRPSGFLTLRFPLSLTLATYHADIRVRAPGI